MSIRIRTGFSFRQAVGKIPDVLSRIGEMGLPAAPMTDTCSTFGWVKWTKACKKAGLRPVYGVELGVTESVNAKKPAVDRWTFVAQGSITPINKLVELATTQFRYEPLLTYEQALAATGVVKIIGHRSLVERIVAGPDLYLALAPSVARGYLLALMAKGIPPVAASDNRYTRESDTGFYEVICGRNASTQTYPQHLLTDEEWAASLAKLRPTPSLLSDAIANRAAILATATATLPRAELLHPKRPMSLRDWCEGAAPRLGVDLGDPVYLERLDRELHLIAEKRFEDYFYIVADLCHFARERMIVGPARGSSCGSLVCYLLGITTVDPIPHGLIFERFIDINRDDLPDIDIDFSDKQRHLVFEYAARTYGPERVARLGTVALYKPRSALQEAGTALRIPKWKCEAVAESLIERSSGDSRALNTLEDTLRQMPAGQDLLKDHPEVLVAAEMEGHPRHYGQHAAGIVIAEKPISEYVAIDHRTGAAMCDKNDAEELNLLKIDALGLTMLSVFEDALELAKLPRETLESLPLDDELAFEVINRRQYSGIFQYNGIALQTLAKQFRTENFNDIVSTTALARPGPLASGGAEEWVRRRIGRNAVTYPHPCFEPFLNDTFGCVLYQEQVMMIGREIGGLTWAQVTGLRKGMSKSMGKEFFDQYGAPWKAGAIAKGVDPKDADKVWDDLCAYGSWSFNKSHSVAYGLISYWCCWMRAHIPFEFAAATLTHETDPDRQIVLLRDMVAEGYDYVPVDPEQSTDKWGVGNRDGRKVLIGPLSGIKGIGPKMMQTIIGARARGERVPERAAKLLAHPSTPIDSLFPIRDAVKRIMPDPTARNIFTAPTPVRALQMATRDTEALVYVVMDKINPRDENEPVKIAKRGYVIKDGFTATLNLFMKDDSDVIFGWIDRKKYPNMGKPIVDRGRVGKAIYAVRGTVKVKSGSGFRMFVIDAVRYIGDMDQ